MRLTFAQPDPRLSQMIGSYYLFEEDYAMIEDVRRADIGYLRFFLEGTGHQDFGAHRIASCPAFLSGPACIYSSFTISGPMRFLGVPLLPDAWGGLLTGPANSVAGGAGEAGPLLRTPPQKLIETLRATTSIEEMKPLVDAYFLTGMRPIADDRRRVIETIRGWLSAIWFPNVAALYDACGLSDRQVTRIANHHFGAAPKALARKYGALRTASHIALHDGEIPEAALAHYADKSHLIREVKRVTGQTPRQLRTISSTIMRITLHPDNFPELRPRT